MDIQQAKILFAAASALAFFACGGGDNSASSQNGDNGSVQLYGAKAAASVANLPTCDSNQVGQLFYVLADQEFRFCSAEGYRTIDLQGANGADGTDGADGEAGADGSSCSVTSNASGNKNILCADGTTATVSDGASCTVVDKKDGSYELACSGTTVILRDGEDGAGCSISDDSAGTLTQTCGTTSVSWPKALCGTKAYEPETHFCDARDSHLYKWTKIGTQTWMAENLAYLPSVNAKSDYSSTMAKHYVYGYDGTSVSDAKASSNYTTYGVLYNWAAAGSDCPSGWHLPDTTEWSTLETNVGGSSTKLKANSSLWSTNTGTDDYDFSALPGGYYDGAVFDDVLKNGYWRMATETNATHAYGRIMGHLNATVYLISGDKSLGFSVRCLQN